MDFFVNAATLFDLYAHSEELQATKNLVLSLKPCTFITSEILRFTRDDGTI